MRRGSWSGQTGVPTIPINRMVPRSFVTNITAGASLPASKPAALRGIAFGGDSGVSAVDQHLQGARGAGGCRSDRRLSKQASARQVTTAWPLPCSPNAARFGYARTKSLGHHSSPHLLKFSEILRYAPLAQQADLCNHSWRTVRLSGFEEIDYYSSAPRMEWRAAGEDGSPDGAPRQAVLSGISANCRCRRRRVAWI